jgi:hypothetical protein
MQDLKSGQVLVDQDSKRSVIGFLYGQLIVQHNEYEDVSDRTDPLIRILAENGAEVSVTQEPSKDGSPGDHLINVYFKPE